MKAAFIKIGPDRLIVFVFIHASLTRTTHITVDTHFRGAPSSLILRQPNVPSRRRRLHSNFFLTVSNRELYMFLSM